jgi:hypothetical protein
MSFAKTAQRIGEVLKAGIPKRWDGRQSILDMRDKGCRNWRQMEWIGFCFQFLCEQKLAKIMEVPGPKYGNVRFDAFCEIPWDFKAHAINTSSHEIIVNDSEATASAIRQYGEVGLILALGKVAYNDEARTFQAWHQSLKGVKSKYELDRIKRGAWSRLRKVSFDLQQISIIRITDGTLVKCGSFQSDFRNADGSPRRAKVLIDLEQLDEETVSFVEF